MNNSILPKTATAKQMGHGNALGGPQPVCNGCTSHQRHHEFQSVRRGSGHLTRTNKSVSGTLHAIDNSQ